MAAGFSRAVLLLAAAALTATACASAGAESGAPLPDGAFDGTIRFGAVVSMTGTYDREGQDTRRGYETWLDWVNSEHGGIRVGDERYHAEIVFYDDQSDPGVAAALTERLVTRDGVDFLLGPYSSRLNASASAVAERHSTLMVTGNAAADALFERGFRHFFSVMTVASRYTEPALRALAEEGAWTVVVAHEDSDFPIDAGQGAVTYARALGMQVLAVETYPRAATDVSGIIAKFRPLDPDVLVVAGYFADSLRFVRAAEEQGFAPGAMVMTVGPSNPRFADDLGPSAEHVIGPTQWEASMNWFGPWFGSSADYAARYSARHAEPPTYQAADATAAALALQLAIERAESIDTEAVRDALLTLDVYTFYGPINFDHRGRNLAKPMGAIQIQQGRLALITQPGASAGALVYPRSAP